MAKTITVEQLKKAIKTSPRAVKMYGMVCIRDSLNAIKQEAVTRSPWRVGQMSGGAPRDTGNLRASHYTKLHPSGLSGEVYIPESTVPYAEWVHFGTDVMEKRPWLNYAKQKASNKINQSFERFSDQILRHVAT